MKGRRKSETLSGSACCATVRKSRMAGRPSTNQQRFLRAASHGGLLLELAGPMASPRKEVAYRFKAAQSRY
jgi:hypothetical protein